tara:strand:- start:749 stop:1708 length:960 start_codon:yes stop_codon:yes gene_type:complete
VHWDHKKLSSYEPEINDNIFLHKRSKMNYESLKKLSWDLNPVILVISGWMDNDYLKVARTFIKKNKITVCALDNKWENSLKQNLLSKLSKFGLLNLFYSHFWVPGEKQYYYAKRLNVKDSRIIFDFYSAEITPFQNSFNDCKKNKQKKYPHAFYYIGRFEKVKGIETLVEAWKELGDDRGDWELNLIGNGSYLESLKNINGMNVFDFIQPEELIKEIPKMGCFILPSDREQWGVVIHEFVGAGLPMLLSDQIGSKNTFFIENFNGYSFKSKNVLSLVRCLKKIINSSDSELMKLGESSNFLSNRITPETSAMNLLSVFN